MQANWVSPLSLEVFGKVLHTMPPARRATSPWPRRGSPSGSGCPPIPMTRPWAHLTVEAARQAGFDRLDVLHEHADGAALLHPERRAERAERIDP